MGNSNVLDVRKSSTNVPKILDLKSSSEQIFSENWRWVPLTFLIFYHVQQHENLNSDKLIVCFSLGKG